MFLPSRPATEGNTKKAPSGGGHSNPGSRSKPARIAPRRLANASRILSTDAVPERRAARAAHCETLLMLPQTCDCRFPAADTNGFGAISHPTREQDRLGKRHPVRTGD